MENDRNRDYDRDDRNSQDKSRSAQSDSMRDRDEKRNMGEQNENAQNAPQRDRDHSEAEAANYGDRSGKSFQDANEADDMDSDAPNYTGKSRNSENPKSSYGSDE